VAIPASDTFGATTVTPESVVRAAFVKMVGHGKILAGTVYISELRRSRFGEVCQHVSFGSADLDGIAGLVERPMRGWKAVSRGLAYLWTPCNVQLSMLTVADPGPTAVLTSLVGRPPDDKAPIRHQWMMQHFERGGTMIGQLRTYLVFLGLGLVALSVSCTRLPQDGAPRAAGGLAVESLEDEVSVPSEWGNLIDVTQHPSLEQITWLWFQDDEGSIRVVWYNVRTMRLATEATVIHRR